MYVYAEHPTTDIWCMAWAFDDEEPEIWTPDGYWQGTAALPRRILEHIVAGGEVRAWNAQFERIIWREIMVKRYGAPEVALEQWVCSAAEAAAMALPRSLDQVAKVLKTGAQKDMEGHRLMMQMCRPRKILADGTPVWWDVPEKIQRLCTYCKGDVKTERGVVPALRRLTPREREIYLLDQRMNDRGILIDVPLVIAAKEIVDREVRRADAILNEITDGAVTNVTKPKALVEWINANGIETDSVAKPVMKELLEGELPEKVRQALQLRADAGRSSVAKLDTMLEARCSDNRARGLLLYHAASTGRWAGKIIQPHNFPRGEFKNVEQFIDAVMRGAHEELSLFAPPIVIISSLLRSMLRADEGKDLIAGDYAAIEARVLNWLAGQDDVVEVFRQYDHAATKEEKKEHDPYLRMARMMGRPGERQAGKAAELGCGFQMGAKKFVKAAWDVYQVRVTEEQSEDAVRIYRESHDKVVDLWWETQRACIEATEKPGVVVPFGHRRNLRAVVAGAYLYVVLPSGRPLCYAAPRVVMEPPPWGGEERPSLHYWGVDPFSRQWGELRTYGGHLVENIVQAVARDLIAEGKMRLEAAGYTPLLSVHDEAICEIPKDFGDLKEFERLLAETPAWAEGCPVAAEAWRGERYRK